MLKRFFFVAVLTIFLAFPLHADNQPALVSFKVMALETAQKFIERIFFNPKKYDLGEVGRYRLNQQF